MCDVCRKYRCADGCPNNYVPNIRKKSKGNTNICLEYTVSTVLRADGESFKNIIDRKIITRKSEIQRESEEPYGEDFGKEYRNSEN